MKCELCFFVIIGLILSQNTVNCINNIGVKLNNLTRRASNGSCTTNCQYYMNLCLSWRENYDCSFFNHTTLSWEIAPGKSKKFALYDQLTEDYEINPLRAVLKCWPREAFLLVDFCRKDTTPVKCEQLRINSTLRRPINDMGNIDKLQLMGCTGDFCLGVSLYLWCDTNCTATLQKCKTTLATPSPTLSAVHPQNTSEIYTLNTSLQAMLTSKSYETTTTHESLKSSKVHTSAGASQKLVTTMYGTSSIMAKSNTYKTTTAFDSSTTVFVETSNYDKIMSTMHSPSWSMVTSSEYKTKTMNIEPLKSVSVETSNDDKIMSTMYSPSLSMVTINMYKTKTINDIEPSKSVFVEPSNDDKIMSTMYSPSLSMVMTNSYKTKTINDIEPSKSVFVEPSNDKKIMSTVYSPSWSMETTNTYKTKTMNDIEPSTPVFEPSDDDKKGSTTSSIHESEGTKGAFRDTSNEVVKRWWFWLCIVVAVVLLILVALVVVKVKCKQRKSKNIRQIATSKYEETKALGSYENVADVSMETFKK